MTRHLHPAPDPPPDDGAAPTWDPRPVCVLGNGPDNVAWLRGEVGAPGGPLAGVFWRGGELVRASSVGEAGYVPPVRPEDDHGPMTVRPLNRLALATLVGDHYRVVKRATKDGVERDVPAHFPVGDADRVLSLPEAVPYARPLRGVTHTPLARADRGLITTSGYDDRSGYLLAPAVAVPDLLTAPTDAYLAQATDYLRNLIAEFAWADPHSEANFLGALLTPLLRLVTPPPFKLVVITARERGSGKSLLARLLRIVHGGGLSAWPADDAELEKVLSSILYCTTAPVVLFDNVRGRLASPRLEALATSATYEARVLGSTNRPTLMNDRLWTFTSNNAVIGGDLGRRVLWVDIDPGVENPELRTGFRIPDLAGYVAANRGTVLLALLVWLAAWDARGRPVDAAGSDDYGRWVGTVRAILRIAGVPGTFDEGSAARAAEADPEAEEWGEFLAAVREVMGSAPWSVRDLTTRMAPPLDLASTLRERLRIPVGPVPEELAAPARSAIQQEADRLRAALPGPIAEKLDRAGGQADRIAKTLGTWFRFRQGQWAGGLVVQPAGRDTHTKGALWKATHRDD